ncbi:MAG: hypothetical protein FI685_05995 [SAR202 cluster bacterium]|nr:hypothetical protein [SAR202 cluster bacterium]
MSSNLKPLKPIMCVRPPNDIIYDPSFWDELSDGGINEVVLQWLCLLDDQGSEEGNVYPQQEDEHPRGLQIFDGKRVNRVPVAAYEPNLMLYEGFSWRPPNMPHHLSDESNKLKKALEIGRSKGFSIYVMDDKGYFRLGNFGSGRLTNPKIPSFTDPESIAMTVTRIRDTVTNFPQISGVFLDGPDFKWEIKPAHRDNIWSEPIDTPENRRFAHSHGINFKEILTGRNYFNDFLHEFNPDYARRFISETPGALASHVWWNNHPILAAWYRFKQLSIEWSIETSYKGIKNYLPHINVSNSSRLPFADPLTGHNPSRKRNYIDFQQPKQYWWSGGVAGFRGTIMNWVDTLVDWNDELDIDLASALFESMFDYKMPNNYRVTSYGAEAPDTWFTTSVRDQTAKMIAGAGGPHLCHPWVGLEHFGSNWLTSSELHRLLHEMQHQGLTRYCYFVYNSIDSEIWNVIRSFSED